MTTLVTLIQTAEELYAALRDVDLDVQLANRGGDVTQIDAQLARRAEASRVWFSAHMAAKAAAADFATEHGLDPRVLEKYLGR